jgi:hypothetical protein
MLFRTSEAVATPALGPHIGSPSTTFSATFKSVRKMAMPFVTSDRVMPSSGPVLLSRGVRVVTAARLSAEVARAAAVSVGVVCTTLTAALEVEAAGVNGGSCRLGAGCEADEAWFGVDRVEGAGLWFLECAGEGSFGDPFLLLSFLETFWKKEGDEDMVAVVTMKYSE